MIGKPRSTSRRNGDDHLLGYVAANTSGTVPGRPNAQASGPGQSYPSFCPCGPVLVTRDGRGPQGADDALSVNGTTIKRDHCTMVFGVAQFVDIPQAVRAAGAGSDP